LPVAEQPAARRPDAGARRPTDAVLLARLPRPLAGPDMGIKTDASIQIDAPPETVFDWLTERDKLAEWTGVAPDYMPADVSELTAGLPGQGTLKAAHGPRKA